MTYLKLHVYRNTHVICFIFIFLTELNKIIHAEWNIKYRNNSVVKPCVLISYLIALRNTKMGISFLTGDLYQNELIVGNNINGL